MDDILKDLGWSDGFRIPVANAENKALELELQKKQKEKEHLKSTLEDLSDRVTAMKKHLSNVRNQLDVNQNLIFAHNNQKATEENLVKLAKIEDSSLLGNIKKVKKELENVADRQKSVQNDINRTLQNVEKLNGTIKWDKDALLAWDEELSRRDDDTFMLEKFRKEDESKFKELDLKRQYLLVEVENKRNRLLGLKNDILSMEQALEKTAEMFRRQHIDRRILVQQWEGAVKILNQRDEDTNRAVDEIRNLKSVAKERIKDLEEQKSFFENEEKNNKELEKDIDNLNKQQYEIKQHIILVEQSIGEEVDKLATLKTVLGATTTGFHKERKSYKMMLKEIDVKNQLVIVMKSKVDKAKEEYEKSISKNMSSKERTQQLENLLKEEEKIIEKNLLEAKKLDELMHQVTQQLSELKEGETNQVFNINHIEFCKTSIIKYIANSKIELNRQKEMLYNMDFAYMEKDIQLNRMLGTMKDQDLEKHEQKINELEEIHNKLMATSNLLNKEVNRLEEDMRRLTMDLQGDAKEQNYLKNKRQDNLLLAECGHKQLKALKIQNQDKQVDINLLKLRVKQAEKAIDKVGGRVFCLEKQRLELEEVMREREIEIKAIRDVLKVRRRVLGEQAAGLNARISLARLKVDHLKNKYEIAVLKLGKDETGEPLSSGYVTIKTAQEKCELQEAGDKLDSKIKKTEKEIAAMENTLKVVNATNRAFKNNFESIHDDSPEQMEKDELEKTYGEILEEWRGEKVILENLNAITVDLEKEYQEKINLESSIIDEWADKNQQAADIEKEIKDQEEKLSRAEKHLKRLIREIRGTTLPKFQTAGEKDIELRELMEQNEFGLQQLAELVAKTMDTGPVVIRYLSQKQITLPSVKSTSGSSKHSSVTSIPSPGRSSVCSKSSKSSESTISRTSSCLISPTVLTLDSSNLSDDSQLNEDSKLLTLGSKTPKAIKSLSVLKRNWDQ